MPLSMTGLGGGATSLFRAGAGGGAGIFSDLVGLLTTLNNASNPSPTNSTDIGNIQGLIESANSSFNVFAVVGTGNLAENLGGTGVGGGKRTHMGKGFNYNTSNSNILSTGNTIVDMTGGASSGISGGSIIDGKKWMAMAQFDGSNFDGILLWIFTGDSVNNSGSIASGNRPVTNVFSIFYPDGSPQNDYHHFYPIALDVNGTIYSNLNSGRNGWMFSNNANAGSTTGYNNTGSFSSDDGFWGFIIPTGSSSAYVDGDSPGQTIFDTSSSTPGFGMGNYNGGDTSNAYSYWNGQQDNNTNFSGFVFSGDA